MIIRFANISAKNVKKRSEVYMENAKIAKELLRMAKDLMAEDYQYHYDPKHEHRPAGNWEKTEKGWEKGKSENNSDSGSGKETPSSSYIEQDVLDMVEDYNNGSLSEADTIKLFQELVKNELVWLMPENYQEKAKELLQQGFIQKNIKLED